MYGTHEKIFFFLILKQMFNILLGLGDSKNFDSRKLHEHFNPRLINSYHLFPLLLLWYIVEHKLLYLIEIT